MNEAYAEMMISTLNQIPDMRTAHFPLDIIEKAIVSMIKNKKSDKSLIQRHISTRTSIFSFYEKYQNELNASDLSHFTEICTAFAPFDEPQVNIFNQLLKRTDISVIISIAVSQYKRLPVFGDINRIEIMDSIKTYLNRRLPSYELKHALDKINSNSELVEELLPSYLQLAKEEPLQNLINYSNKYLLINKIASEVIKTEDPRLMENLFEYVTKQENQCFVYGNVLHIKKVKTQKLFDVFKKHYDLKSENIHDFIVETVFQQKLDEHILYLLQKDFKFSNEITEKYIKIMNTQFVKSKIANGNKQNKNISEAAITDKVRKEEKRRAVIKHLNNNNVFNKQRTLSEKPERLAAAIEKVKEACLMEDHDFYPLMIESIIHADGALKYDSYTPFFHALYKLCPDYQDLIQTLLIENIKGVGQFSFSEDSKLLKDLVVNPLWKKKIISLLYTECLAGIFFRHCESMVSQDALKVIPLDNDSPLAFQLFDFLTGKPGDGINFFHKIEEASQMLNKPKKEILDELLEGVFPTFQEERNFEIHI